MKIDDDPRSEAAFRLRPLALAAVGSIPAALTLLFVRVLIDRPLEAYVSSRWNDSVGYWHQIKSFSKVGFACGQYGWNETAAPIQALHYDVHGPLFPILYGSVASVFGWAPWSAFFYNWAMLVIGVVTFGMLVALTPRQVALLGGLLGCCWTIPLYLLSPNQEPVHMAAGFVFAGAFGRLLFGSRTLSRKALVALWTFLTAMCLMRVSWCVLAVPLLILLRRRRSRATWLGAIALGAVYALAVVAAFRMIAAPGGNSLVELLGEFLKSPQSVARVVTALIAPNVRATFTDPRYGSVQAWVYLAVLLVVLGIGVEAWRRRVAGRSPLVQTTLVLHEVLFHGFQLGAMLVACWLFYIANGYERVLLPHLLLSLALLVVARRDWLIVAVIVAMAVGLPRGLRDFKNDHWIDLHIDTATLRATNDVLERLVPYQKDARSRWCNTILIDLAQDDWHVIAIPAGIGKSWVTSLDPPLHPLFSRYVWATTEQLQRLRSVYPEAELELMFRFDDGVDLYRNERSACESGT